VKVAYVVYNERPTSGLVRTQVISLLKAMKRADPTLDLILLAFWQPWVAWRYRNDLRAMRAELAASGITQINYPVAVFPSRYFLYQTALFPLLHWWVKLLFRLALRSRYDIVHCRGYLASFVATELKSLYSHRVIFDMRSLWPKEHITIGAWRREDAINQLWARVEAFTIHYSDASVGVSPAMIDEIRRIRPSAHGVHIPICVDIEEFRFDPHARDQLRAELGWSSNIVIAYQGSFGLLNSNLAEVAEQFAAISRLIAGVKFLILTSNLNVDASAVLAQFGVARTQYVVRHPERSELAGWLSAADAGIHAMSAGPDSATRLGVKVVEYLSCSLPIIVNSYVGAAASLVNEHAVGVVLDGCDDAALRTRLLRLFSTSRVPHGRARELAANMFSLQSCARQYTVLYHELMAMQG
jgi:glycosyltransferase involved in cell wall biosynthesis